MAVTHARGHDRGVRTSGRLLAALYPSPASGLSGTIRRLLVLVLLAIGGIAAIGYLAFSRDAALGTPVALLLVVAFVAAVVPWDRFEDDAFVIVGLAGALCTAWLIELTDGVRSPFTALFLVALGLVTLPLSRGLATATGLGIAGLAGLPLAYERVDGRDMLAVAVWATLFLLTALVVPLLMRDVRAALRGASETSERLGTERTMTAELSRSQEARKEYMSVLAHELRNPLVGIGATARVMVRHVSGTPAEAQATGIITEVQHALELLDALTDVSSIEADRLRSALRAIDIGAVVREAISAVNPAEHPVTGLGIDRPVLVLGDERRLGQVVRNLVGNAAKYSPAGAPIEVSVGRRPDQRSVIVAVKDAGPGIPPAERRRLFEKFARLSTAGATRGSGLGLYISREIVKDHGGELWADWPAGGGSVFSFSLAVADGALPPAGGGA